MKIHSKKIVRNGSGFGRNVLQFRAVLTYGDSGEKFYGKWYSDKRCAVYDTHNTSNEKHDAKFKNYWRIEERIVNLDAPEQLSLFDLKL